jgi:hypothetical protein
MMGAVRDQGATVRDERALAPRSQRSGAKRGLVLLAGTGRLAAAVRRVAAMVEHAAAP